MSPAKKPPKGAKPTGKLSEILGGPKAPKTAEPSKVKSSKAPQPQGKPEKIVLTEKEAGALKAIVTECMNVNKRMDGAVEGVDVARLKAFCEQNGGFTYLHFSTVQKALLSALDMDVSSKDMANTKSVINNIAVIGEQLPDASPIVSPNLTRGTILNAMIRLISSIQTSQGPASMDLFVDLLVVIVLEMLRFRVNVHGVIQKMLASKGIAPDTVTSAIPVPLGSVPNDMLGTLEGMFSKVSGCDGRCEECDKEDEE